MIRPAYDWDGWTRSLTKIIVSGLSHFRINLVTWWSRIWPRQEFIYANKITVDWVDGAGEQQCLEKEKTDKAKLTGVAELSAIQYEELFWLQARTRGRPCYKATCRSFFKRQLRFHLEVMLISKARDMQPLEVSSQDDVARSAETTYQKSPQRKSLVKKSYAHARVPTMTSKSTNRYISGP